MTLNDVIKEKKVLTPPTKGASKMPGFMDILSLFTGTIGAGVSAWQGMEDRRTANEQFQAEMDFNRETRNMTWAREDNQLQRAKQDAIAAGFSPLAAIGNTASGGGTVSAPGSNATRTPIDMSGLMGAMQMQQQEQLAREEMQNQRTINEQNNISAERIAGINTGNAKAIADADRAENSENARLDREQAADQFRQTLEHTQNEFNKNDAYRNAMLQEQTNARTNQEAYQDAMMWNEWYKQNKAQGAPMGKICGSWDEYNKELNNWYTRANAFLATLEDDTKETNTSNTKFKAGLGIEEIAEIGGESNGIHTKETNTASTNAAKWDAWIKSNPQPIPPRPDKDHTSGSWNAPHTHSGGKF